MSTQPPECMRGGNLGIDCAIGSLVREFELITLRMRVLLKCFEQTKDDFTEKAFRHSYEMSTAGQLRDPLIHSFGRARPKDVDGLAALRETDGCWFQITEARNLVVHSIPSMFEDSMNLWSFDKKFRIPKTKDFKTRREELQPEHIYSFGQEIYRFTLELVEASRLFQEKQSIAEAFQLAKKYGSNYDPFNDFTVGPST